MQKLSNVFKEAKKYLWDGEGSNWDNTTEEFICHAIEATNLRQASTAKRVVMDRLGKDNSDYSHTVTSYLVEVVRIDSRTVYRSSPRVQKYRKDWLTSLEMEFKQIECMFPNGVHHIDGDMHNWEVSNLIGVEKNQ